jgi:hypothetical protein
MGLWISVCLGVALATLSLQGLWSVFMDARSRKREEEAERKDREIKAMGGLAEEIQKVSHLMAGIQANIEDGSGALNGLLAGITSLAKAQADTMDQLKNAVDLLQQSMSPDHAAKDYEEYATETPASIRAMEEQEIRDIMRRDRGLDRESAEAKVRERRIYEQMARGR